MYFKIPELGNAKISTDASMRPIVIITSNSEKALPDAFLRRCVYYNIDPPGSKALEAIVAARLGKKYPLSEKLKTKALEFYQYVIDLERADLSKKPSTAELLAWLLAMHSARLTDEDIAGEKPSEQWVRLAKACLFKQTEDQQMVMSLIERWNPPRA